MICYRHSENYFSNIHIDIQEIHKLVVCLCKIKYNIYQNFYCTSQLTLNKTAVDLYSQFPKYYVFSYAHFDIFLFNLEENHLGLFDRRQWISLFFTNHLSM